MSKLVIGKIEPISLAPTSKKSKSGLKSEVKSLQTPFGLSRRI